MKRGKNVSISFWILGGPFLKWISRIRLLVFHKKLLFPFGCSSATRQTFSIV